MVVCEKLYRTLTGKPLCDRSGLVCSHKIRWCEVIARTPLYFDLILCAKKLGKPSPQLTSAQYSRSVWCKFADIAPTAENTAKPFLNFILAVDKHAPRALPVPDGSA